MLTFAKPFLSLMLCLLLACTGHTAALADSAEASTGQMVICTGSGPVTVYFDAEGQPTSATHICPDCVLVFCDICTEISPRKVDVELKFDPHPKPRTQSVEKVGEPAFRSRAPPDFV